MDQNKISEIRTELVDIMLGFIEEKKSLEELLNKNAEIRSKYNGKLPKDINEVVNKLYQLSRNMKGSTKKQLSREAIIFIIDDLLMHLTN